MTPRRIALLTLFSMVASFAPHADARVLGGKAAASDCYLTFEGIDGTPPVIECSDGSDCDSDGLADGQCTFQVSVCVFATDVAGCTAAPVTKLKGAKFLTNRPTLPASAPTCGAPNTVVVPLKGKNKDKPSKKKVIKMKATTDGGMPKKDPDKFALRCVPKAGEPIPGDRTFSINYKGTMGNGSHFYSSELPGSAVEDAFDGTLFLRAGTPGPDGVATLEFAQDSYFFFHDLGGGSDCTRVTALGSMGKLDCNGGTSVGVRQTLDSGGPGAGGPNGQAVSVFEQGPPGRPGDGYVRALVETVTCSGVFGIPGGCPGVLPNSAEDCAEPGRVDYSKAFVYDTAFTTGSVSVEIVNPRQARPTAISGTGTPFDCNAFVGTNAPGTLVLPLAITDIEAIQSDAANYALIDD